ncbi:M48 family metallopeptidase [Desulfovibrio sp. OttesenSCG-928-G15]|nr:M48 family metallopeptidase [Desulfovibrio sp. OttesenSCG-928-G15]
MQRSTAVDQDAYSIRRSARAGRISLRVVPGKGLEIVLPLWADESVIPMLLEKHKKWIARTLSRHAQSESGKETSLPETVLLDGGQEEVRIVWQEAGCALASGTDAARGPEPGTLAGRASDVQAAVCRFPEADAASSLASVEDIARPLSLAHAMHGATLTRRTVALAGGRAGALPDQAVRLERLRAWIRAEASKRLAPLVAIEAERLGLQYATVRVKFQKSRWGSCSVRGNINLNACLIFLPEHLVRYIIIHELCHIRALNHSPAFWKQVFAADPCALAKDRAMRTAWRYVPGWVFAGK